MFTTFRVADSVIPDPGTPSYDLNFNGDFSRNGVPNSLFPFSGSVGGEGLGLVQGETVNGNALADLQVHQPGSVASLGLFDFFTNRANNFMICLILGE